MYEQLREDIQRNIAHTILRVNLVREPAPPPMVRNVRTSRGEENGSGTAAPAPGTAGRQPVPAGRKPGRNDPCWCGSGKKYKRCHGA
ncbi:MAG: SEC-C domain-containing protein [Chloroflexi bacterium]|nr:SEC-C domain-containing protein [Chloroflexota bacterium]